MNNENLITTQNLVKHEQLKTKSNHKRWSNNSLKLVGQTCIILCQM